MLAIGYINALQGSPPDAIVYISITFSSLSIALTFGSWYVSRKWFNEQKLKEVMVQDIHGDAEGSDDRNKDSNATNEDLPPIIPAIGMGIDIVDLIKGMNTAGGDMENVEYSGDSVIDRNATNGYSEGNITGLIQRVNMDEEIVGEDDVITRGNEIDDEVSGLDENNGNVLIADDLVLDDEEIIGEDETRM